MRVVAMLSVAVSWACRTGVLLAPLLTMQCASPLGVEKAGVGQKAGSGQLAGSDRAEHSEGDMSPQSLAKRKEMCARLFSAASAFGLENCWQWKPLMDGKQVGGGRCFLAALAVRKSGPSLWKWCGSWVQT